MNKSFCFYARFSTQYHCVTYFSSSPLFLIISSWLFFPLAQDHHNHNLLELDNCCFQSISAATTKNTFSNFYDSILLGWLCDFDYLTWGLRSWRHDGISRLIFFSFKFETCSTNNLCLIGQFDWKGQRRNSGEILRRSQMEQCDHKNSSW